MKKKSALSKIGYKFNLHLFNRKNVRKVDYSSYINFVNSLPVPNYKCYPCVTPMWDNTSRRKKGIFMFTNNTPSLYGKWLKNVCEKFEPFSSEENLIFINAWNEWAEGNHLEPDQKWGTQYLDVTASILRK